MDSSNTMLQFVPFTSCINPSFWHKLSQLKLDVFKLDETATNVWGYYSNLNCLTKPILEVDSTSFNSEYKGSKFHLPYYGLLINKNTVEQFKDCDKKVLIKSVGSTLESHIKMGQAIKNPSLLNNCLILSYADLKKYNFYYWFAFPTLSSVKPNLRKSYPIVELCDEDKLNTLCKKYSEIDINNKSFFLVSYKNKVEVSILQDKISNTQCDMNDYEDLLFAFSDSSKLQCPGWSLCNFIILLLYHCPTLHGKTLKFLGFRLNTKGSEIKCDNSIIWEIVMPNIDVADIFSETENLWIGYEINEREKMGPRLAKMKDSMCPASLAESYVDINLKLMKWRLLPDIDLDKIKNTKCLLLGAGTLGCAVARNLLAWGVRTVTFVDNGNVSYSNPVRQNLYTFEDCASNKLKAPAAAESLLKIFPGVTTVGHNFTIPMPGHPVSESVLVQESCKKLTKLIAEHDVIFLLMDSRESRWLPTVICTCLGKTTINAALGFDTYLVMRHGVRNAENSQELCDAPSDLKCIPGTKLGCYFCNDITAPGDSLRDRTLDQQCTVTRPGIANIAAALAVELAISVLQHEKGASAPAFYKISRNGSNDISRENECSLGIVPHSIRGFLSMFNHILPATERYNQCIACSDFIVKLYEEKEYDFLLQVFNDSSYLERVTGLNKMYTDCGELEELNLSDEESP